MMAEVLGIQPATLARWQTRQEGSSGPTNSRGRPEAIGPEPRQKIRHCYLAHFGQWGPQVMAQWCIREGLGRWSPTTVAAVLADLVPPKEAPPPTQRYEMTASQVMWSEDGTGFGRGGRKRELLVVQDECSRKKLNWRLVKGPACSSDVVTYLEEAFLRHGAPLVLKHDGDAIFHEQKVQDLLRRHQVVDLTSPPYHPGYNGKQERSMRDIKSYERAMRQAGIKGSLAGRLEVAVKDLNEDRPRPVLEGRTACEAHQERRSKLPDRGTFMAAVERQERMLYDQARTRRERNRAHRWAVEQVLMRYGLMVIEGSVSHD